MTSKMPSEDTLLSVDNLQMHYPIRGGVLFRQVATNYAVDGVTFDLRRGETLGLVGESGCGKSTVAKSILRLYEPTGGSVKFEGRDILSLSKKDMRSIRSEMQIIFQDPMESLNSRHTVGSILEEPYVIHNMGTAEERKVWVKELLAKVGLQPDAANRYPHEFSGGQRQRIGIARAIALKPKLLVCDEPVSALDVSIQSQIMNLLIDLQKQLNLALLFIAHDLAVVKHVSDRIAVMYLGKIVEISDAQTLYKNPSHPYTRALIDAIPKPDPDKKKALVALQGEVPSPINPPSGCHFHTRCPYVQDKCRTQEPDLINIEGQGTSEGLVACHFPVGNR
ncbi:dipeptide ABC transporter ATP-binding protein [Aurantivibrio plasticivorans]